METYFLRVFEISLGREREGGRGVGVSTRDPSFRGDLVEGLKWNCL